MDLWRCSRIEEIINFNPIDVVSEIVCSGIAYRVQPICALLINDCFCAVISLNFQSGRENADDGYQGEANDTDRDGYFHHCEAGLVAAPFWTRRFH
jgi:hypothetical protein